MKMIRKISRTSIAVGGVFAVIILVVTASTWWPYIANWERLGWMKPQISRAITDAKVQTLNLTTCAILLENMTNGDVVSRWIDVPSMSWPNGFIKQSKSYKVEANADTLKIKANNLGMPVLLAKTFINKLVFVEGIWAMPSGQVYLIVQIADLNGIKKPGYYGIPEFAIRFFATKPIAEQALPQLTGSVTMNFPLKIDPASFTASSGWSKHGDNDAGRPGFNGCNGYFGSNEIWCPRSGRIEYTFWLDQTPTDTGIIQVSFRGSSENAPSTDIQLLVNGKNVGMQTFPADNGRGANRSWKFSVNLLSGGDNELTFVSKKNGLVIYRSIKDVIKLEYFPV